MDPFSGVTANASSADLRTVQGHAAIRVLDKAMDIQASSAAQLIAALPQPAATPKSAPLGPLGSRVDTYA